MSGRSASTLCYQGAFGPNDTKATLVSVSVEIALLVAGVDTYEKVLELLKHEHGCHILSCYKHPEYLNKVLTKLKPETSYKIVKTIRKELEEYSYIQQISKFLSALDNYILNS